MSDGHLFETLANPFGGDTGIPVHPQPGIFETTVAVSGEDLLVDHDTVLAIMGTGPWDVRDMRARIEQRVATERHRGWGRLHDGNGKYHYFEPHTDYAPDVGYVRSLCGLKHGMAEGGLTLHMEPEVLDPEAVRCGRCVIRRKTEEIEEAYGGEVVAEIVVFEEQRDPSGPFGDDG